MKRKLLCLLLAACMLLCLGAAPASAAAPRRHSVTVTAVPMAEDDFTWVVEDGVLTIAVEQKTETNEEDKARNYVYRERRTSSMSRSFSLEGVNEEGITAEYVDGVLHLTLPKAAQPEEKVRNIEIR